MDRNSPTGILTGLAMIGIILCLVISDSALTFQQALTLAVQNPLTSAPVGLLLIFLSCSATAVARQTMRSVRTARTTNCLE